MEILNDIEAACVIFALHEQHERKKQKKKILKRRHWVHPLNLKRPESGQFQVTFLTLRSYPEEFLKYYRMSIKSFDELVSRIMSLLNKNLSINIFLNKFNVL